MKIRDYSPEDKSQIEALFQKQGFEYELPDFNERQFVVNKVVEDNGRVIMAICARQTVELYMISDKEWETPRWRFEALRKIHEAMREALDSLGFRDAHCWLPPQIAKTFGKRLMRTFQWKQPLWTDFTRETRP